MFSEKKIKPNMSDLGGSLVPKTNELLRFGRAFVRIPKAGAHPSTTNMLEYVPASMVSPFFVAAKPERSQKP